MSERQAELKAMSKNDLVRKVVELEHILARQVRHADIWVESGVNDQGKPFVSLGWGDMGGQLSVEEARQHGLGVIEAAYAADMDSRFVRVLEEIGIDRETAVMMLSHMRVERGSAAEASGQDSREVSRGE